MFRDQLAEIEAAQNKADDSLPEVPSVEQDDAATDARTDEARALIEATVEEAAPAAFVDPIQARITTALQAPLRASENLVKPVVPIIPAPSTEVAPIAAPDVPSVTEELPQVCETEAEVAAESAPVTMDTKTEASTVDNNDTVYAQEHAASDEAASQPELRPDLAEFVKLFAPEPVVVPEVAAEQEPTSGENVVPQVADEAPVQNIELATTPEQQDAAPEPTPEPALDSVSEPTSNVVAFEALSEAAPEATAFEVTPIHIVEESIVVEPAVAEIPTLNFCEMQVGVQEEAFAAEQQPSEPTLEPEDYTELLPCADADDVHVSDVSVGEIHEPQPTEDGSAGEVAETVAVTEEIADVPAAETEVLPTADLVAPPHASQNVPILIAEDDPDDRMFMREAFEDSDFDHEIAFVGDGQELLEYLNGEGEYKDSSRPGLIILDLNMPRMDGRTALLHIKANPSLRRIPVIVLTTSRADDDIEKTYDLGVSSYISKPSSAEGLKEVITTLNGYWSNLVALPHAH